MITREPESARPPRLSRWLLEWATIRLGTPDLAADATELFEKRARMHGALAARRWYRAQARAALARTLLAAATRLRLRSGGGWLAGLDLNAKLAVRMLRKYPTVTVVGGLAMAIGIGLGAAYLEVVHDLLHPTLPFSDGDRIVALRSWDIEENDPESRQAYELLAWREQLESVEELGAFRSIERNVSSADRPTEPATGAEISASAFRVTGVPALMGRTLVDGDEREGAPGVVVLGYRLWQNRFSADPDVIGRTVRLGDTSQTVVGVMPEGFAFPVAHDFWVPLRVEALRAFGPRDGPSLQIFGRLAPGVELEEAWAELLGIGLRAAADSPATHEHLQPQIMPYAALFVGGVTGGDGRLAYLVEIFFIVLLLVLGSNVATMVFARTVTRENEIAMRFALGASRGQIVTQVFVETLALALVATAVALAVVALGTEWLSRSLWEITQGRAPFWIDGCLNATTVVYAGVLAVLVSLVAGVMPALRITRSRLQTRLRQAAGVTDTALRFGGVWTAVIVVQVAFAVMIVQPAIVGIDTMARAGYVDPGFDASQYLSARIEMDLETQPVAAGQRGSGLSDFQSALIELRRRLIEEPEVARITFATRLPGMDHPNPFMEVDSVGLGSGRPPEPMMITAVDEDFFGAFGAEVIAGRALGSADLSADARAVVVNEDFVRDVLGGRNAIGRRVRRASREPGPWYEIVGVVSYLGMDTNRDPFWPGRGPGIYEPLTADALRYADSYAARVAFHVRGEAEAFAPRLREIAQTVSADLRLYEVLPLDRPVDRSNRAERLISRFFSSLTALFGFIALLISIAGTYSVMSFTVSRQTREIGVRIALGASRRRIVTGVFARALAQLGVGVAVGAIGGGLLWGALLGRSPGLLSATVVVLALVGLSSCGVPVRRALRIEPSDALRDAG